MLEEKWMEENHFCHFFCHLFLLAAEFLHFYVNVLKYVTLIQTRVQKDTKHHPKVFWVSNPPPTTGNNYHGFSIVKIWQGCKWSAVLFWQSLREENQNYEMELARVRAKYEEETSRLKDSHTESLEDLQEKHRVQQESARNAAEREKSQLLNVRTHTCVRIWRFRFAKDDKCMFLFADFVLVAALFSVLCLINCLEIICTSPKCIGAGLPVCKTN